MTPTQQRKHVLTGLSVNEISLCDAPANALTDPTTGRKTPLSVIALYKKDSDAGTAADRLRALRKLNTREVFDEVKRMQGKKKDKKRRREKDDDPGTQDVHPPEEGQLGLPLPQLQRNQAKSNKESNVPKLRKILKGETVASRALIEQAVVAKAAKIAQRKGLSREAAESQVWQQPGVQEAYESVPVARQPQRAEPKTYKATAAEAELDRRARKRMARTKCDYAKAITDELDADPSLYTRYTEELASNSTPYDVPENSQLLSTQPGDYDRMVGKRGKAKSDSPEECPECDADVDEDDSYCSSCGADLEGLDKKRKARAS